MLLMEELRAADRTAASAAHLFGDEGMQWAEGDLRRVRQWHHERGEGGAPPSPQRVTSPQRRVRSPDRRASGCSSHGGGAGAGGGGLACYGGGWLAADADGGGSGERCGGGKGWGEGAASSSGGAWCLSPSRASTASPRACSASNPARRAPLASDSAARRASLASASKPPFYGGFGLGPDGGDGGGGDGDGGGDGGDGGDGGGGGGGDGGSRTIGY